MATMRAIQVAAKGEPMTLVEIPIPQPGKGQVLLKVEACGICHGDSKVIEGAASSYPRIPGHEVVGIVDKLGEEVSQWKVGQRVGIGWHGGHGHTTALTTDGGYAEYMVAYEDGLIAIPDEITAEEAAPLLCAGETTFSALHNSSARPGDLVAISGVGGLGHLAIQYAKKAGYEVVAISRGIRNSLQENWAHIIISTVKRKMPLKPCRLWEAQKLSLQLLLMQMSFPHLWAGWVLEES